MLKEILDKETCAKCQICCSFVKEDVWEAPFKVEFKENQKIALCPKLDSKTGCTIKDDKPFDCKIWPFRLMKKEDKYVIAIASFCPALGNLDDKVLKSFLEKGLKEEIYKIIDK